MWEINVSWKCCRKASPNGHIFFGIESPWEHSTSVKRIADINVAKSFSNAFNFVLVNLLVNQIAWLNVGFGEKKRTNSSMGLGTHWLAVATALMVSRNGEPFFSEKRFLAIATGKLFHKRNWCAIPSARWMCDSTACINIRIYLIHSAAFHNFEVGEVEWRQAYNEHWT